MLFQYPDYLDLWTMGKGNQGMMLYSNMIARYPDLHIDV